ncbi:MAG TPA: carboxypeptidase regulatory-like domain-containing protein [Bryobacteraceae bacterium]|nr:carboxypeptidase regulatory-like domain-containing protein [Bryobacteraceae bacterium]
MRLAWSVVLVWCLYLTPLHAQFSGRVTGAVVDASGAAVPGAQVDLVLAGGKKALMTVKTSADGLYHLIGIRPADFDVVVQAQGFVTVTIHNVTVDAARETQVPLVKLQLAAVTQSVEVVAETQSVEISSAEVSGTISMEDIRNLPILGRDPLSVLQTQPGVIANGNSPTVINGLRTSYSDITLDGVNIQDNYIRDNALDYVPNRLLLGQVRQMTLVSSNGNAASFGGATETAFSTPSGTNQFHGEGYWYNRNNYFSANDWFNNQSGIARPFLNQNQMGTSVGGPIMKDKLFFYSNYEAVRDHQQVPVTTVIPTATARQGIFMYRNTSGVLQQVNLLNLRNTGIDPAIQSLLNQIPGPGFINTETPATAVTYAGNVLSPDGLNTGGYRFNQRGNEIRDNVTGKLDYNLSTAQALSLSVLWNRDNSDRPDLENDYAVVPKAYNPTHANFAAASWRWTPTATLTNELRGGFNLTYGYFLTTQQFGSYYLADLAFSDPLNEFQPQGRTTNTFSLSDNAAWQHGRHYIQFGFHGQDVRVRSYDASGVIPNYGLAMGVGEPALTTRNLPGISQTDLANANNLLATLGGYVDSYAQTLNVTSRTSGFVSGAPFVRHFLLNDYDFYGQDKFKVGRTLTLTLGLRWELPGTLNEENSLELQPVLQGTAVQTLLSNATLNFAGSSVGSPYYNRQWRDFAPNFGFAWDVFGDGKTALRGGYSISYVNDQEILAPEDSLESNGGLQGYAYDSGLTGRVSTGLPPIVLPTYQVPLTAADNYAVDPYSTLALIDPNLKRPRVQQYSIGIQHDFRGTFVEARYVGNHGVGEYRAFDYNQVQITQNGFLADFLRAQSNGYLAQKATGVFNPNFNPIVSGSQPLTVFPQLANGVLSNPTYLNLIQTGEPGELATQIQINGDNGKVNFFPNPNALSADLFTNYSSSSYNSLQLVARHRLKNGLSVEANYTYSKVLSDGDGDLQSRYQAFLDINNPKLERSRANFDMNHVIKAFGEYALPFGKGHRLDYRPLNRVIGGWTFSSIMTWQSGAPFSILSGRGTLNSEARSYYNTATTSLIKSQLDQVVKFQMTGNGPMMVSSSALNPADQTGVNADGSPQFTGQVFSNPTAGNLGVLQRRLFSGPWTFDIDMALLKTIPITEKQSLEFRADAFNAVNHATFWVGDQNINSTTFGVISSLFYSPRIMQFGLHYRF